MKFMRACLVVMCLLAMLVACSAVSLQHGSLKRSNRLHNLKHVLQEDPAPQAEEQPAAAPETEQVAEEPAAEVTQEVAEPEQAAAQPEQAVVQEEAVAQEQAEGQGEQEEAEEAEETEKPVDKQKAEDIRKAAEEENQNKIDAVDTSKAKNVNHKDIEKAREVVAQAGDKREQRLKKIQTTCESNTCEPTEGEAQE